VISKSYVPSLKAYKFADQLSPVQRREVKMHLQAKKTKAASTDQALPGVGGGKTSKRGHYLRQAGKEIRMKQREAKGLKVSPVKKHYEPIFKASTSDFNHKAARQAYDLIMKMDEDSAEMFVNAVVGEVLEDTISKNLRTLQRRVNHISKRRTEMVKKALVSKALKDPEGVKPYAEAFSQISKSPSPYDYGYRFRESDFSRDPSTGRFRTKVTTNQKKPLHTRTAHAMGLPGEEAKNRGQRRERLSDEELAAYQDQYRQLSNFLSTVHHSGNPGDHDVIAHIRDKRTKQVYTTTATSTRPADLKWDAKYEDLVGLDARPTALTLGGAYFGLASALGAQSSQANAGRVRALNQVDQGFNSFATDWGRIEENDRYNTNAQTYRRIKSGSELLGAAAPPGSKVALAARFGQFVGDHGAEAEAVFGPPTRRAAYRYRGTEKTPDRPMVRAYEAAVNDTKLAIDSDPYGNVPEDRRANLKNPRTPAPSQMAAVRENAKRRVPTWEERANGRRVIAAHLENRMPRKGLYNLQLASGNTPPSEGVILDSKGRIVSQAVGYGDDHYLPFNLKHLKGLKGGEYIRTRSVGGPTTEDIYTGLMSGARQLTVVSRSGTFTVEFEEDFRGGRRHNDKAKRMTRRYAQLLDAVQSQQIDRRDLDPATKDAIRATVMEEYQGLGLRPMEINAKVQERIEDFKSSPELTPELQQYAEHMAAARALGTDENAEEYIDDALKHMAEQKETKFRLNGVGYDAALRALQEQFPYYIKSRKNSVTLDPEGVTPNIDRGYVEPGRNRPAYAAAGLFNNAATSPFSHQGNKFSAADADYQIHRKPTRAPSDEEAEEAAETEEKKTTPADAAAEVRQRIEYAQAARGIQERMAGVEMEGASPDDRAARNYTAADLRDPAKQQKFDKWFYRLEEAGVDLGEAGVAYKAASGKLGQEEYTDDLIGIWGSKPYKFPDAPEDDAGRAKRLAQLDAQTLGGITVLRPLSRMVDAELEQEFNAALNLNGYIQAAGGPLDPDMRLEAVKDLKVKRGAPALDHLFRNPELIEARLRALHEVRALNQGVSDEDRGAGDIVVPAPAAQRSYDRSEGNQSEHKRRMQNYADNADRAARWLKDETTDDNLVKQIQNFAAAVRAEKDNVRGVEDVDHFLALNQSDFQAVNDVFRRMHEKAPFGELEQKKKGDQGGGSILS